MSTSVASVVWLRCDIIDRVEAFNKVYFGDITQPKAKSLEKYSKNNKLEVECFILSYLDIYSS